MSEENIRLSSVINYDEHLRNYRLIQIVAGVGAGKNYWAGYLIKQGYRVLLITSRAATANAQANKLGISRWIDLEKLYEANDTNVWGDNRYNHLKYKNVICTNAGIAKFVKKYYSKDDPRTHLWNMFDFIILDEAHSLTTDATFTDAPFYVEHFLKYCYHMNKEIKIVMMTGTPEPVTWLFPDEDQNKNYKCWDFFNTCTHLTPETVRFDSFKNVAYYIQKFYSKGEKIIYFANTINRIKQLVDELVFLGIPLEEIFVSFSKGSKECVGKFPKELTDKMKSLQDILETTEHLPEGIRIFITTSKNKEGINIEDKDLRIMFAESHERSALVQMAGRVRSGLKYLCVLYDVTQFKYNNELFYYDISNACISGLNEKSSALFKKHGKNKVITYVENTFEYIRYDIFQEKFYIYRGKAFDAKTRQEDNQAFDYYIKTWSETLYKNDSKGSVIHNYGKYMMQKWFPESNLVYYTNIIDAAAFVKQRINDLLVNMNVINTPLSSNDRTKILNDINQVIRIYKKLLKLRNEYKNLGSALDAHSDYRIKKVGAHSNNMQIIFPKEIEDGQT